MVILRMFFRNTTINANKTTAMANKIFSIIVIYILNKLFLFHFTKFYSFPGYLALLSDDRRR